MAKYIPLDEAAQLLGITPDRLVEMRSNGDVRGFRDGASWKFSEDEIERVRSDLGSGDLGSGDLGSGASEDAGGLVLEPDDPDTDSAVSLEPTESEALLAGSEVDASETDSSLAMASDLDLGSDLSLDLESSLEMGSDIALDDSDLALPSSDDAAAGRSLLSSSPLIEEVTPAPLDTDGSSVVSGSSLLGDVPQPLPADDDLIAGDSEVVDQSSVVGGEVMPAADLDDDSSGVTRGSGPDLADDDLLSGSSLIGQSSVVGDGAVESGSDNSDLAASDLAASDLAASDLAASDLAASDLAGSDIELDGSSGVGGAGDSEADDLILGDSTLVGQSSIVGGSDIAGASPEEVQIDLDGSSVVTGEGDGDDLIVGDSSLVSQSSVIDEEPVAPVDLAGSSSVGDEPSPDASSEDVEIDLDGGFDVLGDDADDDLVVGDSSLVGQSSIIGGDALADVSSEDVELDLDGSSVVTGDDEADEQIVGDSSLVSQSSVIEEEAASAPDALEGSSIVGGSSILGVAPDVEATEEAEDHSVLDDELELDPAGSSIVGTSSIASGDDPLGDLELSDAADDHDTISSDSAVAEAAVANAEVAATDASALDDDSVLAEDDEPVLGGSSIVSPAASGEAAALDSGIALDSAISLDSGIELDAGGSELDLDISSGSELAIGGSSDLDLEGGEDSVPEIEAPAGTDLGLGSEVALEAADTGGSALDMTLGSDVELSADTGGSDALDVAIDSELALGDDDDMMLSGSNAASDLALSAEDSGISLSAPSDSGLSLEADSGIQLDGAADSGLSLDEDEPLDVGGSSISSLELPEDDDVVGLEDSGDAFEDLGEPLKDEEFLLSPSDEMFTDDSDSGSQVIALEDSAAFDGAPMMPDGMDGMMGDMGGDQALLAETEGLGQQLDSLGGGGAPATAMAAAPAAEYMGEMPEADYSVWNLMGLSVVTIVLLIGGVMMFDMMTNMWMWQEGGHDFAAQVSEGLTKAAGMD